MSGPVVTYTLEIRATSPLAGACDARSQISDWHKQHAQEARQKAIGFARNKTEANLYVREAETHEQSAAFFNSITIKVVP